MKNQKKVWEAVISKGHINQKTKNGSTFSEEVLTQLSPAAKILELGCGMGDDASFFARNGNTVLATDFSQRAIDLNQESYKNIPNLSFQILDISNKFPFSDLEFDLVYARLSLHYFTDKKTKEIFKEIKRVLKPGGIIAFVCKSIKDPLFGKGKKIETNMFESDHVRHFFSERYVNELLSNEFEVLVLGLGKDNFYNSSSAYVKVIARKI